MRICQESLRAAAMLLIAMGLLVLWTAPTHAAGSTNHPTLTPAQQKDANSRLISLWSGQIDEIMRGKPWVVTPDQVRDALAAGASLDTADENGLNILTVAALSGRLDIVKVLLDAGANVNARAAKSGGTALMTALTYGHVDVAKALIDAGADVNAHDYLLGFTALEGEVMAEGLAHTTNLPSRHDEVNLPGEHDLAEIVKLLIESGADVEAQDKGGQTVLIQAAFFGLADEAKQLLADGANPQIKDYDGHDALYYAEHPSIGVTASNKAATVAVLKAARGSGSVASSSVLPAHALTGQAALNSQLISLWTDAHGNISPEKAKLMTVDAVKAALSAGADKEAKDGYGNTALMIAATFDLVDIARELLSVGANKEVRDGNGDTVLMIAAENGSTGVGRLLLTAGADKDARDYAEQTALVVAASNDHPGMVKLLLHAGVDREAQGINGNTAMMEALVGDYGDVVKVLLDAGEDREAQGIVGETPLMNAALWGDIKVMKVLLSAGADAEAKDDMGQTVLMKAADGGHVDAVKMLLRAGAKVNTRDLAGHTALYYAEHSDFPINSSRPAAIAALKAAGGKE